jgi:hypothetical protein
MVGIGKSVSAAVVPDKTAGLRGGLHVEYSPTRSIRLPVNLFPRYFLRRRHPIDDVSPYPSNKSRLHGQNPKRTRKIAECLGLTGCIQGININQSCGTLGEDFIGVGVELGWTSAQSLFD